MRKILANKVIISILLAAILLGVFWQVQKFEFISFDDGAYVRGQQVQAGLTLKNAAWAFKTVETGFWYPLAWLSFMVDREMYGENAGGYHWTNVLLHIGATILLFLALAEMTGDVKKSGIVAALFAVHPLHIEPVAWVASRKDVLSTFFMMLSLFSYARYARSGNMAVYGAAFLSFVAGLMSKAMIVSFPVILLLLDFWPLRRIRFQESRFSLSEGESARSIALEKAPFLIAAVLIAAVTFLAESKMGAVTSLASVPLTHRLANAVISCALYLWKTIWPFNLAVFYPYPQGIEAWPLVCSVFTIVLVSAAAWKLLQSLPPLAVGWLWYVITLVPVSGLVQIGSHSMADRYSYVPLIGIFMAFVWGVPTLFCRLGVTEKNLGPLMQAITAACLSALIIISWQQLNLWRNSFTILRHAIEVTEQNYMAHTVLALAHVDAGDNDAAILEANRALEINPGFGYANGILGMALQNKKMDSEAVRQFNRALQVYPNRVEFHRHMAVSLGRMGRHSEAAEQYRKAIQGGYDTADIHNDLGICLARLELYKEAQGEFERAIALRSDDPIFRRNLALALLYQGRKKEAEAELLKMK